MLRTTSPLERSIRGRKSSQTRRRSRSESLGSTGFSFVSRYRPNGRLIFIVVAATLFVYLVISEDRPVTTLSSDRYAREDRRSAAAAQGAKKRTEQTVKPARPVRTQLLDPDPVPRPPPDDALYDPDARYLAYFTHSGYHNQALENALVLARLLNRTLLMPPVYLGTAIPYIEFDKLYSRVNAANKYGLDHCATLPPGSSAPRECIGFNSWTTVGWNFLIDLNSLSDLDVIDRWNGTYDWIEEKLGIGQAEIHSIKDARMYQFRIQDEDAPLDKWEQKMPIESLRALSSHRLIHFGTIFGSNKLRLKTEEARKVRSEVRRSMVFRNPKLDAATDAVRDRLGGPAAYNSIHMRIGDGVFAEKARSNALGIFRSLCIDQLGLDSDTVDRLTRDSDRENGYEAVTPVDLGEDEYLVGQRALTAWRDQGSAGARPRIKYTAYDHDPLPPLRLIRDRTDSPLHPSLRCRGDLHTADGLQPLNTPLFIATDARQPLAEPSLRIFFDALPCTFVLGDFLANEPTAVNGQPVEQMSELEGLRNAQDNVPLSQFLMPILDMMIAAKGRAAIGTPASTFSRFAVDVLYQTYHGWPIRERG